MNLYYSVRYVTAAGDQKASNGSPGSVEVIYCRDTRDGVTASFSKDTSEVKPGQKKSGPLLMFLNKGECQCSLHSAFLASLGGSVGCTSD